MKRYFLEKKENEFTIMAVLPTEYHFYYSNYGIAVWSKERPKTLRRKLGKQCPLFKGRHYKEISKVEADALCKMDFDLLPYRWKLERIVADIIGENFQTIETHFEPQFPPQDSIDKYYGKLPEHNRKVFVSRSNCFNYLLYQDNQLLGIKREKTNYNNDSTYYLSLHEEKYLSLRSEIWQKDSKGISTGEIKKIIEQCHF